MPKINPSLTLSSLGSPPPIKPVKILYFILSCLLIALISYLDFKTGYIISLMMLYLIPVTLCTIFVGGFWGYIASFLSGIAWVWADIASGRPYSNMLEPLWNMAVRMFFFSFAVVAVELRKALIREREQAKIDILTGVANRRYFYEVTELEMERCQRYKRPFTIVFLDCDDFKAINDRRGHHGGDAVLRLIARVLKQGIRSTDVVARFGGDEFVILLLETSQESARHYIGRLQDSLRTVMHQNNLSITFSFGVVTYLSPPPTIDDVIKRADLAMYAVKSNGKNDVRYEQYGITK